MVNLSAKVKWNKIVQAYYLTAIAPAIARPSAADLPRPRAASKATVLQSVLSRIASRNVMTAFPYSNVVNNEPSYRKLSNHRKGKFEFQRTQTKNLYLIQCATLFH